MPQCLATGCAAGMPHLLLRSFALRRYEIFRPKASVLGRNRGRFHILSDYKGDCEGLPREVSQYFVCNQRIALKDKWEFMCALSGICHSERSP